MKTTGLRIVSWLLAFALLFVLVGEPMPHLLVHAETLEETEHSSHVHNYTVTVYLPGCVTSGYTYYSCDCGHAYVTDVVEPLGHTWGEYIVEREPAFFAPGSRYRSCQVCGWEQHEDFSEAHDHFYIGGKCCQCGEMDPDYTTPDCGLTEETVYQQMLALQPYLPEEMHWDNSDLYIWQGGHYYGGYGCAGFAFMLSDAAFGSQKATWVDGPITIQQIRVGDVLRVYDDTHSVIVLEVHADHIIIAEGNYGGTIHWGRVMTADEVLEDTDYLMTRYPSHSYETEITEPTCTQPGYITYTCACGDSYVEAFGEALGHCWDEGVIIQEPTEEAEGECLYTCTLCGETRVEAIPMLEHTHAYETEITEPTCTQPGCITYTCACGDSYVEAFGEALGHSWDEGVITQEPTEEAEGECLYTCTLCGETRVEAIPMLEHTHSYETEITEPTCTQPGYITYTCACGDSYEEAFGEALGHSWDEGVITQEPTEEAEGECLYTCTLCGETRVEAIPMLEHVHVYEAEIVEPTCTEDGYGVYTCACGDSYSQILPATGHIYEEVVTDPSCTRQGYTTHICVCGDYYVDNYTRPVGHLYGPWYIDTLPTCTEDGREQKECARCGRREYQAIPALGHERTTQWVDPTCTQQGYLAHICATCGDVEKDNFVDALGHDWSELNVGILPDCTNPGLAQHECFRCGELEVVELPPNGHIYASQVIQPTCTEGGYTIFTCHCGYSCVGDAVAPLGHSYDAETIVTQPTCTEGGYTTYVCVCGEVFVGDFVEPAGHRFNASAQVTDPTCTENGYTTYYCHCGESRVADPVAALGHDYGQWYTVTDPTCTENGQARQDCARCGHFETRTLEATGHNYQNSITDPTCTLRGYTTHSCVHCGYYYLDEYTAALGHSFTQYISDNNATAEADGTETAHCDRNCGATDTRVDVGSKLTINTITSRVFRVTERYLSKIPLGTTVDALLAGIEESDYVKVFHKGTEIAGSALVGTGMEVRLVVEGETKLVLEIVLTGDTNGDGKLSVTDMIAVKSHVLKKTTLEGAAALAADVSGDGNISITDFIQIKAHILGKSQVTPQSVTVVAGDVHTGSPLRSMEPAGAARPSKARFAVCWTMT